MQIILPGEIASAVSFPQKSSVIIGVEGAKICVGNEGAILAIPERNFSDFDCAQVEISSAINGFLIRNFCDINLLKEI